MGKHGRQPSDTQRQQLIDRLLAQHGIRKAGQRVELVRHNATVGPLSSGQQRLWLLDRLQPGSSLYNVAMAWRIDGELDEAVLASSLTDLAARHDVLRTTFPAVDGVPQQVVSTPATVLLEVDDLSGLSESEREQHALAVIAEDSQRPFDLARGPLFRARLVRIGPMHYVLSLVVHHIIFDDWSLGVLLREVAEIYRANATGTVPRLEEVPIQYLDWAIWERGRTGDEGLAQQLDYWRCQLDGAPTSIDLPVDHPRSRIADVSGSSVHVQVDATVVRALEEVGREEGCTLFMTLLAAWQILLYHYSGQSDIVVGAPIASRRFQETHSLIGFFLNTIALRTDLRGDPTLRAVLGRVREIATSAYANRDVPFDSVVDELRPERRNSQSPLFQVWFAADDASSEEFRLGAATCTSVPITSATSKFDLSLFFNSMGGHGELVLEYNSALFERATAERMLDHLKKVLDDLGRRPDRKLSEVDLVGPVERDKLLRQWNNTAANIVDEVLAHRLFERQVRQSPDAVAAIFGEQQISYLDLDRKAEAIARLLRRSGVAPGEFVAVAISRSFEMLASVLAVLKIGAAYVPLDPGHPAERIRVILDDLGTPVILTDRNLRNRFPLSTSKLIDVEGAQREQAEDDRPRCQTRLSADAIAYVTYTSGSTGRPKGICMPHRAVTNLVGWQLTAYGRRSLGYRTMQFASLSFDVSFQEIFSTLGGGGTLVLISEDERRDVHGLIHLLHRYRVNRLFIPAVALQQVAEGYQAAGRLPTELDTVIAGSEQLLATANLVRFFSDLGSCRLHNEYGPSETHVTAAFTLPGVPSEWPAWVPIGKPIANTRVYVLDTQLRPTAIGVRGEVYVGGLGLAHGYLNRPELTAAHFLPDPFARTPGARMYRTGDLARYLPSGDLEFIGRADSQVKIRGFRVELGEVETALERHPDVRATLVKVTDRGLDDKRLVAYLVPNGGCAPTASELRRFLRSALPDYMVPSAYVVLERFPLTINGKVDQRKLPIPGKEYRDVEEPLVAPRDELERGLVADFQLLLGVDRVGMHDDFFELGGHSLIAARLVWTIGNRLGMEISLSAFFKQPTVDGVARAVRDGQSAATPATIASIGARADTGRIDEIFDTLLERDGDMMGSKDDPRPE